MGKFEKKSFFAGVATSALAISMIVPAFAAVAGSMTANLVNIISDGEVISQEGDNYTLQTGASVPSSITYEDENGGWTVYLPVRRVSEILGTEIAWDEGRNAVVIGEEASTPSPAPSMPNTNVVYYSRYPSVPDFGAFAGIQESDIGDLIDSDGYYYDIIDFDNAQAKNENLLVDYHLLLFRNGFSYVGEFDGGYGSVVCYSDGQYTVGVGIIDPRFFAVVITRN